MDGAPFPTLYWLTCRRATSEIGRLEGQGFMDELNARLASNPSFARTFAVAQRDYIARRDALHELAGAGGIGGGPLDRIKCLHAHYAHHAATGINPVGAAVEERAGPLLRPPRCV